MLNVVAEKRVSEGPLPFGMFEMREERNRYKTHHQNRDRERQRKDVNETDKRNRNQPPVGGSERGPIHHGT